MNGIYKLTSAASGLSYIGEAQDIFKRWVQHETDITNKKDTLLFYKVAREHPDFTEFKYDINLEILEVGDFTKQERLALENKYIKEHNTV